MNPISSYKELFDALNWDNGRRESQRWYLFLLMNPQKITSAGMDLIKNFSYMDERTENVTFFIPGLSNSYYDGNIIPYMSNNGHQIVYQDDTFGPLYFDQRGFLDTVRWLECGSGGNFSFNDNLNIVLVRYKPEITGRGADYTSNFNLADMVFFDLDWLDKRGVNTLGFIHHIKDVVRYANNEYDLMGALEDYIFRTAHSALGYRSSRRSSYDRFEPVRPVQTSRILVAGSSRVQTECDTVVSVVNNLPQRDEIRYSCRSVSLENLRSGGGGGFVCVDFKEADKVIFVLDGHANDLTVQEFQDAVDSIIGYKPVHVYGKKRMKKKTIFSFMDNTYTPGELAFFLREGKIQLNGRYVEFENEFELENLLSSDLKLF